MGFPSIETFYGRYLRGKIGDLPPKLGFYDFYRVYALQNEEYNERRAETGDEDPTPRLPVDRDLPGPDELESALRSRFFAALVPEVHWLASGRPEYRITPSFASNIARMRLEFPASRIMVAPDKPRTIRVVRDRNDGRDSALGAYVTTFVRSDEPDYVELWVQLIERTDPTTIDRIGEIVKSRVSLPKDALLDDLMLPFALDHLVEGSDLRHTVDMGAYFRLGAITIALAMTKHRCVQPDPTVTARWPRRAMSAAPHAFVVGKNLPTLTGPISPVPAGRVSWERFGDDDGQLLIEWPENKTA